MRSGKMQDQMAQVIVSGRTYLHKNYLLSVIGYQGGRGC